MSTVSRAVLSLALAVVGVVATSRQVEAQWYHEFYKVDVSVSPYNTLGGGISGKQTGWVNGTKAVGASPTLSAAGAAYVGANSLAAIGENNALPFWTNGAAGVQLESVGFGLFNTPSFNTGASFYPAGEVLNNNFQRAAYFRGVASNFGAGQSWSLNGDDDAWLFIDGVLAIDNGGVKAFGNASNNNVSWSENSVIEIFFADRRDVQARLAFTGNGLELSDTDPSIVPEPSTFALLVAGCAGLGLVARRRRTV